MSGFFSFAAANFACLSGNCSLRAVMMLLGRVVWSALVVKWSASLLASTFGFTVVAVGACPFIFLICRQICVVLISASWLHHLSHCCFFRSKSCRLVACWQRRSFSLFRSVGLALKILVSWLTCFVHFLASGGRKERVDWVAFALEMGIASVAAEYTSCSSD